MAEYPKEPTAPMPLQRTVISVLAGIVTALVLSLIVGVILGIQDMGIPAGQQLGLLKNIGTGFLLTLFITLPFGFILVPVVSLLFRRPGWRFQLLSYSFIAAAVTQWLLPYSPGGDRIPFFAFAALGGLLCFVLEHQLLHSSAVLKRLSPTAVDTRQL